MQAEAVPLDVTGQVLGVTQKDRSRARGDREREKEVLS
jgi:hypothetical protein